MIRVSQRQAILLFPPNWTACAMGPHLGLPLVAGAIRGEGWAVETWDLTRDFIHRYSNPPRREDILHSVWEGDFHRLDNLYFDWEDELRGLRTPSPAWRFGLLSGYQSDELKALDLHEAIRVVRGKGVFSQYFRQVVAPRLKAAQPDLIGVSVASEAQLLGAIELLEICGEELPEAFRVLGGNIVTRLRDSAAINICTAVADRVVLFQGEAAAAKIACQIGQRGVEAVRKTAQGVVWGEDLEPREWPVPYFAGLTLDDGVSIPVVPFVSTRGCYYGQCPFCAIPAGWNPRGYGGSLDPSTTADHLRIVAERTGVHRFKFVDEALSPRKTRLLSAELVSLQFGVQWEAYARLETPWEDPELMAFASRAGLRKLYFGLEQVPSATRGRFGKNDRGSPHRIMEAAREAGVALHFFCMVGHPGTSAEDAYETVRFLIENESAIDTADLVRFRLDRGTSVPGARPLMGRVGDWAMSMPYEADDPETMSEAQATELEWECQEALWGAVPRLLHPLYRLASPWAHAPETAETELAVDDSPITC